MAKRYKTSITLLENKKDLSTITLIEVTCVTSTRETEINERKMWLMYLTSYSRKFFQTQELQKEQIQPKIQRIGFFSSCPYCRKNNHQHNQYWYRLDAKCHKYDQLGHVEKIYKSQYTQEDVKIVEEE